MLADKIYRATDDVQVHRMMVYSERDKYTNMYICRNSEIVRRCCSFRLIHSFHSYSCMSSYHSPLHTTLTSTHTHTRAHLSKFSILPEHKSDEKADFFQLNDRCSGWRLYRHCSNPMQDVNHRRVLAKRFSEHLMNEHDFYIHTIASATCRKWRRRTTYYFSGSHSSIVAEKSPMVCESVCACVSRFVSQYLFIYIFFDSSLRFRSLVHTTYASLFTD